mgnify:CR=1 FL=1
MGEAKRRGTKKERTEKAITKKQLVIKAQQEIQKRLPSQKIRGTNLLAQAIMYQAMVSGLYAPETKIKARLDRRVK